MGAQSQVARDAILGFGTLLEMRLPGGEYTALAGVKDLDGPELAVEDVKVTHQESPSATHEYIPGLKEGGAVSFDVVYVPESAAHGNQPGGLAYEFANREIRDWRITWPNTAGTQWTFRGYVNGFKPAAPLEDHLAASVSIKLAAAPTLA